MKNKPNKIDQKLERQSMIAQGFFDGRFAPKQVPDKKKLSAKRACRGKVTW